MFRPFLVTLISIYLVLNAVFGIVSILFLHSVIDEKMATEMLGVSPDILTTIVIMISVISIILAYGYYQMSSWGFWMMIIYSGFYSMLHLILLALSDQGSLITLVISIILLIYTLRNRYVFYQ